MSEHPSLNSGVVKRSLSVLLTLAVSGVFAADSAGGAKRPGGVLPALVDIDGKRHDCTAQSAATAPVVVLAWTGVECPLARLYRPRLLRLADEFADRGVRFFLVDSNSFDSAAALRKSVGAGSKNLTLIRDAKGDLARRVAARRTTEVFVFNRERQVVYRGAVDDQYGFRRGGASGAAVDAGRGAGTFRKDKPTRSYLREAIVATLAKKAVVPSKTDPLGCALEWNPRPASASGKDATGKPDSPVTFHGDVEPILQQSCQNCHRQDGNAPFALLTYEDAKGWARMIREVVTERRMPPWGAHPDYGVFANDMSLSGKAIETLQRWVDSGRRRGDPERAPPPRQFAKGWAIGKPDVVYQTPEFDVPAEGTLPYRYVNVETSFEEDRWVEAMQIRSTAPVVVHHVLILFDRIPPPKEGTTRPWSPPFNPMKLLEGAKPEEYRKWIKRFRHLIKRDFLVGGGGMRGYFASSSSGSLPQVYPPGRAKLLPAGTRLVFQIHYTPNGEKHKSTTELALRFAKAPPREPVDSRAIATVVFKIPPGDPDYAVQATMRFPADGRLLSLRPHMHVRGKSFRYVAEYPGGRKATLLDIPRWDFDWQLDYIFKDPPILPRGTTLRVLAKYDNSEKNPYNPDPTKTVYFGLQTEDEMMIGYYDVVWQTEE